MHRESRAQTCHQYRGGSNAIPRGLGADFGFVPKPIPSSFRRNASKNAIPSRRPSSHDPPEARRPDYKGRAVHLKAMAASQQGGRYRVAPRPAVDRGPPANAQLGHIRRQRGAIGASSATRDDAASWTEQRAAAEHQRTRRQILRAVAASPMTPPRASHPM